MVSTRSRSGAVHGVHALQERQLGAVEDLATLFGVVAIEAHDERLGRLAVAGENVVGLDDAVSDGVTRGDATEDVDKNGLDLRVFKDDVQAVGHDFGVGAAADVEEVRGLRVSAVGHRELFTCIRDHVERGHDEASAVSDDADATIELDVVEVTLDRENLERVGLGVVDVDLVLRVTEGGVLVDRHLAVERDDLAVFGLDEGVDLDERGVFGLVHIPEFADDVAQGGLVGVVKACGVNDLLRLGCVDAHVGVDGDLGERFGALDRESLDVHAAFLAAHRQVSAVGAVEQDGEVVLLGDLGALGDHDRLDGVALDVHPEDLLGSGCCLVGALDDLDAASLPAPARIDLSLDDNHAAALGPDSLCGGTDLVHGPGDFAAQHGNPVCLEHVACLVFVQIHGRPSSSSKGLTSNDPGPVGPGIARLFRTLVHLLEPAAPSAPCHDESHPSERDPADFRGSSRTGRLARATPKLGRPRASMASHPVR